MKRGCDASSTPCHHDVDRLDADNFACQTPTAQTIIDCITQHKPFRHHTHSSSGCRRLILYKSQQQQRNTDSMTSQQKQSATTSTVVMDVVETAVVGDAILPIHEKRSVVTNNDATAVDGVVVVVAPKKREFVVWLPSTLRLAKGSHPCYMSHHYYVFLFHFHMCVCVQRSRRSRAFFRAVWVEFAWSWWAIPSISSRYVRLWCVCWLVGWSDQGMRTKPQTAVTFTGTATYFFR